MMGSSTVLQLVETMAHSLAVSKDYILVDMMAAKMGN